MRSRIRLALLGPITIGFLLLQVQSCMTSEETMQKKRRLLLHAEQKQLQATGKEITLTSRNLGFAVRNLTDELFEHYGYRQGVTGVIVSRVEPGSLAYSKGIRPGMGIHEVNRKPVKNTRQFWDLIEKTTRNKLVLLVTYEGKRFFMVCQVPPASVSQSAQTGDAEAASTQPTSTAKVEKKTEEPPPARSTSVWTPGARQCLWVLAVGVGQYKDPQIPALPFARKDAERVRDWFVNLGAEGVNRDNAHVLFDEQATRENLLAQIDWLRKQALPEDAVFVYFAGHGAPELAADGTSVDAKYLVLYDTDPTQLFVTGFSLDELTRRLDAVKARTQVVVLEACYAGPVGQEILKKTPTADLEIRPRLIQKLGEKGGRVILSASSGRQIAIGSDEIEGGLFTHYLLDAWGDGSQRLLTDRFEEAIYQVRRASNRLGSLQEPVKFGDQNVDVVLKVK